MTSQAVRDPQKDELLTPHNAALIIIDFQPVQVNSIASMDRQTLVNNIVGVAKLGVAYDLPIVFSSVNVKTGLNKPPIVQLRKVLGNITTYDRTTINAWEDTEFNQAVKATKRKKLIMAALWTEACLTYPALDALREGYEVYPVVDAVGGTSVEAHQAALRRIEQAGAKPIGWVQLACELQRDWIRKETVPAFMDIFIETGGTMGLQLSYDKDSRA
jgi:nicotinamidase-related amidase